MRSESSCGKGTRSAPRILLPLAVSFILICATACGAAPEAGGSALSGPGAETKAADVAPEGTEGAPEPVGTTDDAGETAEQIPAGTETKAADVTPEGTEGAPEPVGTTDDAGETAAQVPAGTDAPPAAEPLDDENEAEDDSMKKLRMEIDGTQVAVSWQDNESVAALAELAGKGPVTVRTSMYGGFEQVGPLGTSLPRNDRQTTTSSGDIVLYSGDQIVLFYGSNSWAYTRLGRMELSEAEVSELLGHGDVTVTLWAE